MTQAHESRNGHQFATVAPPHARGKRLLLLCDWLPPDFGAVGQYALAAARELAARGHHVKIVGFSTAGASITEEPVGKGHLTVRRLARSKCNKAEMKRRLLWTARANVSLLWRSHQELRWCEEVVFSGSPPGLLHFVLPVAKVLRKKTRYRITDFYPECLIAACSNTPPWLAVVRALTYFWRRRVDTIEVLGEDQRVRILESRVDPRRVQLVRDGSPVEFAPGTEPAERPAELEGMHTLLYSGNLGFAHDVQTMVDGLERFSRAWPGRAGLWLNATGTRVHNVEGALRKARVPFARTQPVALSELARVLLAADVHLITLSDPFVGYVLPSKVYACIESKKPILFVGSAGSDVHLLCSARAASYRRVDVGDAAGFAKALDMLLPAASASPAAVPSHASDGRHA